MVFSFLDPGPRFPGGPREVPQSFTFGLPGASGSLQEVSETQQRPAARAVTWPGRLKGPCGNLVAVTHRRNYKFGVGRFGQPLPMVWGRNKIAFAQNQAHRPSLRRLRGHFLVHTNHSTGEPHIRTLGRESTKWQSTSDGHTANHVVPT